MIARLEFGNESSPSEHSTLQTAPRQALRSGTSPFKVQRWALFQFSEDPIQKGPMMLPPAIRQSPFFLMMFNAFLAFSMPFAVRFWAGTMIQSVLKHMSCRFSDL